jgi:uncharacterized membrane protein (DUF485 family)
MVSSLLRRVAGLNQFADCPVLRMHPLVSTGNFKLTGRMREEATPKEDLLPEGQTHSVHRLMRRQAALSLRVAIVFIVLLVGLPLLNLYFPKQMATQEMGFTFTWLLLGVLFFPITWLLSAYFVKRSDALEHELANAERSGGEPQP